MSKTLLVMAGGTGGHIFPALAVAQLLRDAGWRIVWLGNPDGMEARLVPQHGFEMVEMKFSALRGKGLLRKLLLPLNLLSGFWQGLKAIRQVRPNVVLGMGGYITFPAGMMAALTGVPLVLHEQNSVAGLANKVLSRVADRIACGFPQALPGGEWVGNPVRPAIAALPEPDERMVGRTGPLQVLVVGGSLGAQALNDAIPQALAVLPPAMRPQVVHQAGEKHLDALQENYENAGTSAHCVSFIEDMAGAYEWADLVICRAGALTVAELAAAGAASVLVPYPHAVDDHQTANARFLVEAGAAVLLPQAQLDPQTLAALLETPRNQLLEMAACARANAKPEATAEVARICSEIAK